MNYWNVTEAEFIVRRNRFIAEVMLDGRPETVHVKNTGRCRELLVPGARVWLSAADKASRKTKYDLIAVEKQLRGGETKLFNIDAQAPNEVAEEWLRAGNLVPETALIRREARYHDSRLDFYMEDGGRRCFLEVKGVTLENEGIASFPDAPTERGLKHVRELAELSREGYETYLLFVVQAEGIRFVTPNDAAQPAFGAALREAGEAGVKILAIDCSVSPERLCPKGELPVRL